MRPAALGRRNCLHLGDRSAGPKLAVIISIVETRRRLDINLREYPSDVLPRLGGWLANRVAALHDFTSTADVTVQTFGPLHKSPYL
jgi:hypothetical protein